MKHPPSSWLRRSVAGSALAGALACAGLMLSAGTAAAASVPFAVQTHAAGLTSQQARQLQGEVDSYLHQTGGNQVSANRVNFAGGYVIVPVPGQRYATDLASRVVPNAYSSCGYGDFCAYSGTSGSGALKAYYICQTAEPFRTGTGSYFNNQTTGTVARLYEYDGSRVYLGATSTAPNKNNSWPWAYTAYVRTC